MGLFRDTPFPSRTQIHDDAISSCARLTPRLESADLHRGVPFVLAIIEAAGWPIWPIIAASVIALGIIGERLPGDPER